MSWSIYHQGTKEEVIAKINEQSTILTENSKTEFDAVQPHLIALVELVGADGQHVDLQASGHAYWEAGEQRDRNVRITVQGV